MKKLTIDDIDERMMAWFDDTELMQFYTSSKNKITKAKLTASIKEGEERQNLFTYGIYTKEQGLLIGTVKIGPIHKIHKTSDMATLIGDRDYLGKGLSVEAVKLGNQLAFDLYDVRKLYSGMYLSNIASIKAYSRAGWIIEGRLKGFYRVDGKNEDRILVGCFNPTYFSEQEIKELKENENRYYQS